MVGDSGFSFNTLPNTSNLKCLISYPQNVPHFRIYSRISIGLDSSHDILPSVTKKNNGGRSFFLPLPELSAPVFLLDVYTLLCPGSPDRVNYLLSIEVAFLKRKLLKTSSPQD